MVAKSVEAKKTIGEWQIARWWRWQNKYMVCRNMIGHYKAKTKWKNLKFNGFSKLPLIEKVFTWKKNRKIEHGQTNVANQKKVHIDQSWKCIKSNKAIN